LRIGAHFQLPDLGLRLCGFHLFKPGRCRRNWGARASGVRFPVSRRKLRPSIFIPTIGARKVGATRSCPGRTRRHAGRVRSQPILIRSLGFLHFTRSALSLLCMMLLTPLAGCTLLRRRNEGRTSSRSSPMTSAIWLWVPTARRTSQRRTMTRWPGPAFASPISVAASVCTLSRVARMTGCYPRR